MEYFNQYLASHTSSNISPQMPSEIIAFEWKQKMFTLNFWILKRNINGIKRITILIDFLFWEIWWFCAKNSSAKSIRGEWPADGLRLLHAPCPACLSPMLTPSSLQLWFSFDSMYGWTTIWFQFIIVSRSPARHPNRINCTLMGHFNEEISFCN